jgi:ribosomal protein S6E (S10)
MYPIYVIEKKRREILRSDKGYDKCKKGKMKKKCVSGVTSHEAIFEVFLT